MLVVVRHALGGVPPRFTSAERSLISRWAGACEQALQGIATTSRVANQAKESCAAVTTRL